MFGVRNLLLDVTLTLSGPARLKEVELRGLQQWPHLHIQRASERIAKAALIN